MLEEPDLTPAERALCKAAAAGRLLDRRTRRPGEDNPARGQAWKDRQIRAQLLRQLLILQPEFVTWLVEGQGRGADEGGHRRSWRCANNQRSDGGRRPQRRG
jgi:hypothetical protein